MAKVKNTFLKGKMNKDLDARLLPNGEYRDAQNLQVSRSESSTVGEFENILGDLAVASTGSETVKIIGQFSDTTNNIIYFFATDHFDSNTKAPNTATCKIFSYNITTGLVVTLVSGYWLNLNQTFPINSVNLVEELLFWTDNLNQPRKINITLANPGNLALPVYYFNEDQVSVAKYYPYQPIVAFDRVDHSVGGSAVSNSNIVACGQNVSDVKVGDIVTDRDRDFGTALAITSLVTVIQITASNTVKLSAPVTLAAGFKIQFSRPTMTNKASLEVSDYSLIEPSYTVAGTAAGSDITIVNTKFNTTPVLGMYVTCPSVATGFGSSGFGLTPVNTGVITSVVVGNTSTVIQVDVTNTLVAENSPNILIGKNPDYDSQWKGDPDFLKQEYVRFSYRFKFVDGEYSLMAPFSQIMFIPQQYGEFGKGRATQNEDMEEAYKSTIVSWMQNNIDNILLKIPVPQSIATSQQLLRTNTAAKLINNMHVESIDVLYKESDSLAVKVLDTVNITNTTSFSTIGFQDLVNGDVVQDYINYNYESSKPYKTLPENQTVRVYDKVPVKALTQEIIGNRVVYGNYVDKHSSPLSINYSASTADKSVIYDNYVQFTNSSLKENRTYQAGIVLADRYGRQSTVVLSSLDEVANSAGSTVYAPYKKYQDNNVFGWLGDSLRITFNAAIPVDNPGPGEFNVITKPLGWYSYKVVVKQTEQDYYNVYLPGFVNGYPVTQDVEQDETAFTILIGDNINKIPRDLTEVSGQQTQFNSSVRLFGRVNNPNINNRQQGTPIFPFTNHSVPYNQQYYPGIKSDFVRNITTTQDGEIQTSPFQAAKTAGPFSNADGKIPWGTTPALQPLYNGDSNPYFAEISVGQINISTNETSSTLASKNRSNQLGAICTSVAPGTTSVITMQPFLTVSETAPVVSLLDIFWETSSTGRVDTLNANINAQYDGLVAVTSPNNAFLENLAPGGLIVDDFKFVDGGGTQRTNLTSAVISSVIVNTNPTTTLDVTNFELITNADGSYDLKTGSASTTGTDAYFWYGTNSPTVNNYTLQIDTTYASPGGQVFSDTISMNVKLQNETPGTLTGTQCPITLSGVDAPSVNDTIIFNYLTGETVGGTANYGKMDNGSVDPNNLQTELTFAIGTQVDTSGTINIFEFANNTDGVLRVKSNSSLVTGETYTILVNVTDNNGDTTSTAPYTGITYGCSLSFTVGAQHINRAPCNGPILTGLNNGCGNYRQIWAFVNSLSQTGAAGGLGSYPSTGIPTIFYGTSNNYQYYNVAVKYSNTIVGTTSNGGLNSGATMYIEPTLRFLPNSSNNPGGNVYYTIQHRTSSGASWVPAVYYQYQPGGGSLVQSSGTIGTANYLNGSYISGGATDYKTKYWFNVAGEYRVLTSYVQGQICSTSDSDKIKFFPDFGDGTYTNQCNLGPL